MADRHYKREKVREYHWKTLVYDQARALSRALILEKISRGPRWWHERWTLFVLNTIYLIQTSSL